ncbi:glycoside hydrolase family 13 protein [Vallicoccus soli]|uniref:glycoside hydrolase family 13 protein n=1 Tax=Vallicoccus soli TaxID=2339232 RepID=UPI0015ADC0C8|nr:glycoside hydrolase family 13 protein [Vallicoccus soli]
MTEALPAPSSSPAAAPVPWWRDAVIYQVYVRSFADADGDGVGDLPGIRSRLPYLRDLGVDAVWITPFYPSPMADGGYDVADYRDIEPQFGTLADADALVADAHALGLRVVVDLVPNHTSDEHAWFRAALAAGPGSPERARYVFRPGRGPAGEEPPNDWMSVFGGPAWERLPDGDWYLHLFDVKQPDLDWANPEVREEFLAILRFWLDRGVDGFRIDVAHGLTKDPEMPDVGEEQQLLGHTDRTDHPFWDRDEIHEVYRSWREVLDAYDGERMAVGEAWVATPQRLARYVRSDELHQCFNFDFVKAPWDAAALRRVVDTCIETLDEVGAPSTWVLSNHDIVRHVTRYGGGAQGLRRARAAALLMLALPGGAYVYQGEELGLPEVTDLPEEVLQDPVWERSGRTERGRDGCRVPVPWTRDGASYGFGPGGSWLPQPAAWSGLSVEAQQGDPSSVLALYRSALRLRREEVSLGDGTLRWLDSPEGTLVFARDPGIVCAVNLSSRPLALPAYGAPLLASEELADPAVLPPDTAAWYRLG